MRRLVGQTINRVFHNGIWKTGHNRHLSSASDELEKTKASYLERYSQSKEDFTDDLCDDVIFLAPDEPIIKGKQAMAEWQSSGLARYGTVKLLSQNCDFIDDNTCVKVDMAEATNDKGEKMRYKNLDVWTKTDGKWKVWRMMFNTAGRA